MAHYALICPDEAGHLLPVGAVGKELARRGHRVTVLARAMSAPIVRQLDLPLHELDASGIRYPFTPLSWVAFGSVGALWLVVIRNELRRYTEQVLRLVPRALEELKVDGVLVDQTVSAGGTVAERAGLPFVTVCSALMWNREPDVPPPFTSWAFAQGRRARLCNRLAYAALDWYVAPVLRKINRHRAVWNMRPIRRIADFDSPLAQISQLCAGFDFPRRRLPDTVHYVGSLAASRTVDTDHRFPWETLDGRPLIFASLGTVAFPANVANLPVYRKIAAACVGLDAQLVLALGRWDEAGEGMRKKLGELPGNHLLVDFAPQLALLDKASLLITHAGVNTVLEAISRGVPMVALPRSADHPGMASRIEHSGVGLRASFRRCTADELRRLIQRVLSEDVFRQRVRELQKVMIAAGGAARAAEIAEEALSTRRPVRRVSVTGPSSSRATTPCDECPKCPCHSPSTPRVETKHRI
jgi:MGT family glycosyltransferase